MPNDQHPTRVFLDRKEAAAYISKRWFKISPATLAKFACRGDGPPYVSRNGTGPAMYKPDDIDAWAQASFQEPATKGKRRRVA